MICVNGNKRGRAGYGAMAQLMYFLAVTIMSTISCDSTGVASSHILRSSSHLVSSFAVIESLRK